MAPKRFFHGCSLTTARQIRDEGFRPSNNGELGPGIYLVDESNVGKAKRFAHDEYHRAEGSQWETPSNEPVLIECSVTLRDGFYKYASHTSQSRSSEWCIAEPRFVSVSRIISLNGDGCPYGGMRFCPYEARSVRVANAPWGGACPCKARGKDYTLAEYGNTEAKEGSNSFYRQADGNWIVCWMSGEKRPIIVRDGKYECFGTWYQLSDTYPLTFKWPADGTLQTAVQVSPHEIKWKTNNPDYQFIWWRTNEARAGSTDFYRQVDGNWTVCWLDGSKEPVSVRNGQYTCFGILYKLNNTYPLTFQWPSDRTMQTVVSMTPTHVTWQTDSPDYPYIYWEKRE